jgi:nitroreductase
LDTLEAIRNRRSIRQLKSDRIPEEVLREVLEAARWAPSWANSQCWRFIVVTDQDIKTRLYTTGISRHAPVPGAPPSGPIVEAPVVIAVCAELNKSGIRPADGTPFTDKGGSWYMYDAGLATQNLCLAAHALGLGTVILGGFDAKKAGDILKVPDGYALVVLVPLGYPAQPGRPPTRKELSETTFYNTFGSSKRLA